MASKYKHSTVMAMLDSMVGEPIVKHNICDTSNAKGFMVTKFLLLFGSVLMTDVQGDVLGVTGYTAEEFKGREMMTLLNLNTEQIGIILNEIRENGVCVKNTTFTKKDGSKVDVISQVVKLNSNSYIETTTLRNKIITL